MNPKPLITNIKFGETQLGDYTTVSTLGKGTYGEVNKAIYANAHQVVAIKTFFFEVS